MVFRPDILPFVHLGAGTLVLLRPDWLRETLRDAARGAHVPECFADDVLSGILSYLKNHYQEATIECGELIARIRRALTDVGLGIMANHVEHRSPPVRINLPELVSQAGGSFELGFFQLLQERFRSASRHGVGEVVCTGLRPCVLQLAGRERWGQPCELLEHEIAAFLLAEVQLLPRGADRLTVTIH